MVTKSYPMVEIDFKRHQIIRGLRAVAKRRKLAYKRFLQAVVYNVICWFYGESDRDDLIKIIANMTINGSSKLKLISDYEKLLADMLNGCAYENDDLVGDPETDATKILAKISTWT